MYCEKQRGELLEYLDPSVGAVVQPIVAKAMRDIDHLANSTISASAACIQVRLDTWRKCIDECAKLDAEASASGDDVETTYRRMRSTAFCIFESGSIAFEAMQQYLATCHAPAGTSTTAPRRADRGNTPSAIRSILAAGACKLARRWRRKIESSGPQVVKRNVDKKQKYERRLVLLRMLFPSVNELKAIGTDAQGFNYLGGWIPPHVLANSWPTAVWFLFPVHDLRLFIDKVVDAITDNVSLSTIVAKPREWMRDALYTLSDARSPVCGELIWQFCDNAMTCVLSNRRRPTRQLEYYAVQIARHLISFVVRACGKNTTVLINRGMLASRKAEDVDLNTATRRRLDAGRTQKTTSTTNNSYDGDGDTPVNREA